MGIVFEAVKNCLRGMDVATKLRNIADTLML